MSNYDMKELHVLTFEQPSGTHCPWFYSSCYQALFLRKHAPLKVPWASAASSQAQPFVPLHFDVSAANWIHAFSSKLLGVQACLVLGLGFVSKPRVIWLC